MVCCRASVALSARVGGHVVGDNSRTRATPARVGRVRRTAPTVTVAAATSDGASRRAALGALTLGGLSVAGFGALPPVAQAGGVAPSARCRSQGVGAAPGLSVFRGNAFDPRWRRSRQPGPGSRALRIAVRARRRTRAASRGMRLFRPELTGSAGEGVVGRAHRRSQGEEARQQRQVPAGTAHPTPMTEGEGQAPTGWCVAVLRKHSTAGASARPILAVVPRPASSYRRAGDPAAACEGAAAVGSDEEGGGVGRAGRGRCGCHGTACWRWRSWWTRMSPSSMLRRARYTHAPHVFIDDPSTPAGYCLLACWHCPPEEWRYQCAPTADGVSLQPHPHAEEGGMNACPPAPAATQPSRVAADVGCGLRTAQHRPSVSVAPTWTTQTSPHPLLAAPPLPKCRHPVRRTQSAGACHPLTASHGS